MSDSYKSNLEQYNKACEMLDHVQRKGKTSPYTSHNGHMFSILRKDGILGIRLSDEEMDAFEKKHGNKLFMSHGATMRNYVTVPDDLLKNETELSRYINKGFEYVSSLKPK